MSELIELNPDEREKMIAYSNQRRDMLHKKSVDRVAAALRDKLNGLDSVLSVEMAEAAIDAYWHGSLTRRRK